MASRGRSIGRPPRLPGLAEPPAIVEPRLRDIPEFAGPELEEVTSVDGGWAEPPVTETFARAARELALADDRMRDLLGDARHVVIGVSRRVDFKDRRESAALVVVYVYEGARTIEAWLAGEEGDLKVTEVVAADYQPAPADEEVERAIELARSHRGISEILADDFESTAILTSDVDVGDLHHGTRRFVVGFGPADERLPRIRALVDLGADKVLAVETASDAPMEGTARE